jgi:hypothetical protein
LTEGWTDGRHARKAGKKAKWKEGRTKRRGKKKAE